LQGKNQRKLLLAGNCLFLCIDASNLFKNYFGDNQRDLDEIEYGIRLYNAFKARGSASSIG